MDSLLKFYDRPTYVEWLVAIFIVWISLPFILRRIWYYYITCSANKDGSNLPLPPGTLGLPIIGETVEFIRKFRNASFYTERQIKYGNIFKTHVMGRATVRISGAENLKKVLTGENTIVAGNWPTSFRIVLGKGALSMASGDDHRWRKKLLFRAFTPMALESYIPTIQKVMHHHFNRWKSQDKIYGFLASKDFAFALASRILCGTEFDEETVRKMSSTFEILVTNMFSLPYDFPGSGLRKALRAKKELISELNKCTDRIEREGSDQSFKSVLHYMIDYKDEGMYTNEEMGEAVQDLLFTGHDTMTSSLCSILMFLGKHPHVMQKIRDELDNNGLLHCDADSPTITLQMVNNLSYINCVAKEVLRLCPVVGAGYRKVLRTFEVGGFRIPKGWTIAYGIRDTTTTSPVFPGPLEFDPSRWETLQDPERFDVNNTYRYEYTPFGSGGRMCVGKEYAKLVMRLFIIEIVKTSNWTLHNSDAAMHYIPVPRAVDNLPLTMTQI